MRIYFSLGENGEGGDFNKGAGVVREKKGRETEFKYFYVWIELF